MTTKRFDSNPKLAALAGTEILAGTTIAGGADDASNPVAPGADIKITVDQLKAYIADAAGAPWSIVFRPYDNEPPATAYATLDLRNNRPVLDIDSSVQEAAVFTGVLPAGYAGGGLRIVIFCALTTAITGTVGWDVAIERTQAGIDDIDNDGFAAAVAAPAVAVPGTSGQVLAMALNVADGAEMDGLQAGELFRVRVRRTIAAGIAAGDAELLAVSIREQ